MKTLGLIGGMSHESTAVYYKIINEEVKKKAGGLNSAEIVLWSFNFARIEKMQASGDWEVATAEMVSAARKLEQAGADCIVICTNTMHKTAESVQNNISIPLLHIADATAKEIKRKNVKKPLLTGTAFTMEQDFYLGVLRNKHGIDAVVPEKESRDKIHKIIYEELCKGIVSDNSKHQMLNIIEECKNLSGIDGVILGCTEIGLLISPEDSDLPIFDTAEIHAKAAADFAFS